jgi:hypothetical protein
MGRLPEILPLATISPDHPCLWGELAVREGSGLQHWRDATLLPPRRRAGQTLWWRRHSFGVFDAAGNHVRELSDMRGKRHCCHPAARLEDNPFKRERLRRHEVVLYGGTLYDQFGHLIFDSGRAYQLLREHRNSDLPIWFHDATPHRNPRSTLKLALVQDWLKQLGLRKRAKLIRRPIQARHLISCGALYNDRGFASRDLGAACASALKPRLRERLETIHRPQRRLAYLSRHRLSQGSTHYAQEAELVAQLAALPHVDVICPEDLNFEEKLALYRRYELIAGFPQACMGLKMFVPGTSLAQQVMFIAGPRSLSSTWVNIDRATGAGDAYLDCDPGERHTIADDRSSPFLRSNRFELSTVLQAIRNLTR